MFFHFYYCIENSEHHQLIENIPVPITELEI